MNRFVRRSAIVGVALATTLSAGVALAGNTGISPEVLKSGLTSSGTATTSLARALKSSSASLDAERFAGFQLAADQREFAAFKTSAFGTLKAGVIAPGEGETIDFRTALARQGDTGSAFGADAEDCQTAPVKLADVGMAMRSLSSESAIGNQPSSLARALQQTESTGDLGSYGRYAAKSAFEPTTGFSQIQMAQIKDGISNTNFADLKTNAFSGIGAALNGSSDAFSGPSNSPSAAELAAALQKR